MLKEKRKILKKCSYYRVAENLNTGGSEYCNLDNQTECTGEIQSCENTEVLNKYVLERGLGWQKKKGRNIFKRVLQVIGRLANARWR
jgi:hypothetical protein